MTNNPAESETHSFLAESDPRRIAKAHRGEMSESHPQRIGPYQILQVLGEGGMGVVYLAEQTKPIHRRIALKLIKLGMDTKQVIARFEAEREVLALMNHPNVARVFDAGTTELGRPYFVMEYVPGISITEYCDKHRLRTDDRLGLFIQVCHAVQHAHQKGIIHRDLKPSNILVSVQDDVPVPKVIDFGVAKATQQKLTDITLATEVGQIIGTPAYMSPEQADPTATDIDTRTDLYSLGVLLYELLSGALPFDSAVLRQAALSRIQQIIREVDPPRPSARLSDAGADTATISDLRRTTRGALVKELRGDLDWIVMKCLEKDRSRRYDTVNALVMEIQRHLNNEPVLAGPPSATYRMRKFVRRNRGPVAAGLVVATVLLGGLVGTSYGLAQAVRAREAEARQRHIAEVNEQRAVQEAERTVNEARKARQVQRVFVDMLGAADPVKTEGREPTVREVLDRAAETIDVEFADQPETAGALHLTIANAYYGIHDHPKAVTHTRAALPLLRKLYPADHEVTADCLNTLGAALGYMFNPEAIGVMRETLAMQRRLHDGNHRGVALAMHDLAFALARTAFANGHDQSMYDEAESLYVEALKMYKGLVGEEHLDVVRCLHAHGAMRWDRGQKNEALPLYDQAQAIAERCVNRSHPYYLELLADKARLLRAMGRTDDAVAILARMQAEGEETYEENSRPFLNRKQKSGETLMSWGRRDEAERIFREVVEKSQYILGDQDLDTLASMDWLAYSMELRAEMAEPEQLMRAVYSGRKRVLGPTHSWTIGTLEHLTRVVRAQEKSEELQSLTRELIGIKKVQATGQGANPSVVHEYVLFLLTCEPETLRDPAEALSVAEKAIETAPTDSLRLETLALACFENGMIERAIDIQEQAITHLGDGESSLRTTMETTLTRYRAHTGAGQP